MGQLTHQFDEIASESESRIAPVVFGHGCALSSLRTAARTAASAALLLLSLLSAVLVLWR